MNKSFYYCIAFLLIVLSSSCQKYIDIDIKSTNPILVINAEINPALDTNQIVISKTTSVFDNNIALVDDAKVTLTDEKNQIVHELKGIGKGIYQLSNPIQDLSATYRLEVTYQNVTYTSKTRIAAEITNPEAQIDKVANFGDSSRNYQLNAKFIDQEPTQFNYYRLQIITPKSDNKKKDYTFFDDSFLVKGTDSVKIQTLATISPRDFNLDSVQFHLESISKPSYQFLQDLDRILNPRNGDFGEKAANPTSTFDNGALGNFSIRFQTIFSSN